MTSKRDDARYRAAEESLWSHFGLQPEEIWVDVPPIGGRVRALWVGDADVRPVILVHGTPTAGGVWAPLVAHLKGVRAVVVDRPGCALSDPLDLAQLTPESLRDANAAWMTAVASAVSDGPVDVVGNSAGGMAAIMFAARHPELVRSLVLDGVPAVSGMRLPAGLRVATVPWAARAIASRTVTAKDLRRSFRAMGHRALIDADGLSEPEIAWRAALSAFTDTLANDLALLGLAADWRGPRRAWVPGPAEVGSLDVPSLWAVGEHDPFARPEAVRRWSHRAPGSQFRMLEGSGHQPWLDGPEQHARMLEAWWERIEHTHGASPTDSQQIPR
ncbi:alpha/beta fold hydrolase [Demequina sp. NBRC 110053]|uniref:alpha/beta fold hydrolase n=1 Tax=Demequina sp. NBRC 110053 TaxID=1570342 RepID=UPI0013563249|nr:alpha/beta hydrolase [Demequina sp. NBRC 110053]